MNSIFKKSCKFLIANRQNIKVSDCLFYCSSGLKDDYPPNNSLQPKIIYNRNPRNLDKLRIADKPIGWSFEKEGFSYWLKLNLSSTGKHIEGKVEHLKGQIPIQASTKEWCINKFLYSTKDLAAVKAVGEVLAQRCLQAGITEIYSPYSSEDRKREKMNIFLQCFENAGIALEEPPQYKRPASINDLTEDEKAWTVFEKDLTPKK